MGVVPVVVFLRAPFSRLVFSLYLSPSCVCSHSCVGGFYQCSPGALLGACDSPMILLSWGPVVAYSAWWGRHRTASQGRSSACVEHLVTSEQSRSTVCGGDFCVAESHRFRGLFGYAESPPWGMSSFWDWGAVGCLGRRTHGFKARVFLAVTFAVKDSAGSPESGICHEPGVKLGLR